MGELGYKEQWCNETNEIIYVDLAQFPTTDVQITCGIDDGRCPGAFHVGGDIVTEDPTEDPTDDPTADPTAAPTVDPTADPTSAPSSGVNMSWNVVAQIFS